MRIMLNLIAAFLLASFCAQSAHADIIHLKNGNKVEGIVVEERADTVMVKLDIGMMMTFSKGEIASIEKSSAEETDALEERWKEERGATEETPAPVKPAPKEVAKPEEKATSKIDWVYNYERGMAKARSSGKPAMIDFYTDWCGWCKKLDQDTYKDSEVLALSTRFICIKIDADKDRSPVQKHKVRGYPTILFLSSNGKEIGRVPGYMPPRPFAQRMKSFIK